MVSAGTTEKIDTVNNVDFSMENTLRFDINIVNVNILCG
jgi:hypothetical protein